MNDNKLPEGYNGDVWLYNFPPASGVVASYWAGIKRSFYKSSNVRVYIDEMFDGKFHVGLFNKSHEYEKTEPFDTFVEAELYFNLKYC